MSHPSKYRICFRFVIYRANLNGIFLNYLFFKQEFRINYQAQRSNPIIHQDTVKLKLHIFFAFIHKVNHFFHPWRTIVKSSRADATVVESSSSEAVHAMNMFIHQQKQRSKKGPRSRCRWKLQRSFHWRRSTTQHAKYTNSNIMNFNRTKILTIKQVPIN